MLQTCLDQRHNFLSFNLGNLNFNFVTLLRAADLQSASLCLEGMVVVVLSIAAVDTMIVVAVVVVAVVVAVVVVSVVVVVLVPDLVLALVVVVVVCWS